MGVKIDELNEGKSYDELTASPIQISNISASFELEGEYEIERLAKDLANSEHDPDRHRSLIYRSPTVRNFTILLPPRGRVSIAGAKSKSDIEKGLEEFISELGSIDLLPQVSDIRIENIVATGDIGKHIDLNAAVIALGLESIEYEPEQFPGAIYRSDSGVILIFSSGKVVITSVETYNQVLIEYRNIRDLLSEL